MIEPTQQLKVDAIIEGAKEFARVVVIAAVSAAVTAGLSAATTFVTGAHLDPFTQSILLSGLTALGKAWDKKVHNDPTTDRNGIVPF